MLNRKPLAAVLALLALGAGGSLAVAHAVGTSVPADKAAALARLASVATTDSSTVPATVPSFEPQPLPGQLLGSDVPIPIAPSLLRTRNGWLVSDGKTLVAVYAGSAGNDPTLGRVVVIRQDLAAGRQTVRSVDAGRTGALTIVRAPLGSSVETSAQTADLTLRTDGGRSLMLDLGTDRFGNA
jgi:hypothetical protein